MNKKTLIKTKYLSLNAIKPLLASFILVVGLSLVVVTSWSGPISTPVNDNTDAPIDTLTPGQEKLGTLSVKSLINTAHGPFITYSPIYVGTPGNWSSKGVNPSAGFYGGVYFPNLADTSAKTLCTNASGVVGICSGGVLISAVSDTYYTATITNSQTISWPGAVTGQVTYDIATNVTCTTQATTNPTSTSWGNGTTLIGSGTVNITFNDWGRYDIVMNCDNSRTYKTTIDIKGKLQPPVGSLKKFTFPSSRDIEIKAQGGGAAAVNSSYCAGEADGWPAYAHVTNAGSWTPNSTSGAKGSTYDSGANLAYAGGGHGYDVKRISDGQLFASGTRITGYNCFGGKGGDKLTMYGSNVTKVVGGNPNGGASGGCPGSNVTSCSRSEDGSGGNGNYGGGGGGYVSGTYAMPANYDLYVYASASPSSGTNAGRPASIVVEWK